MRWIPDATGAQWLAERLESDYATMHGVVPRGFEAYARVFHPASARSLPGRPLPTPEEWSQFTPEEHSSVMAEIVDEEVTWAHTAEAFGTTLHPLAQWNRIIRAEPDADWQARLAPDGREFSGPAIGALSPVDLANLAAHLVARTTTPDEGFAAVWEGFGDLLGHMLQVPPWLSTWQEGILSRDISESPRLQLPGRGYVLFSAAPRVFADPAWILDAPWRNRPSEAHGYAPSAQHPNIIWPADHAWVMVSEIDFDSTIVAGSAELVRAICNDPMLEASPLTEGARLTWDADEVNE